MDTSYQYEAGGSAERTLPGDGGHSSSPPHSACALNSSLFAGGTCYSAAAMAPCCQLKMDYYYTLPNDILAIILQLLRFPWLVGWLLALLYWANYNIFLMHKRGTGPLIMHSKGTSTTEETTTTGNSLDVLALEKNKLAKLVCLDYMGWWVVDVR